MSLQAEQDLSRGRVEAVDVLPGLVEGEAAAHDLEAEMVFRKADHQAMQSMYHFKIKADPAFAWGVPELVREIKIEDMNIPIRNKR